jgi:hypothetical protein
MALGGVEQQQTFWNLKCLVSHPMSCDNLVVQCKKNLSLDLLWLTRMRKKEKGEGSWE